MDDEGNEILVKVVQTQEQLEKKSEQLPKLSRKEQVDMLESMLKSIESLPPNAMTLPINHYDFYSFMLLVLSILKEEA